MAVQRPGHLQEKQPDQPDKYLSLPETPRRVRPDVADVLTALLLVALTGFCGGRFPLEAVP